MSIETWEQKFYPKDASKTTQGEAIAHSLQKWRGLRPDAIKAHGLTHRRYALEDDAGHSFVVDSKTCALCFHFYSDDSRCSCCPLAKSRDGVPCMTAAGRERRAPYERFLDSSDPEPMIAALEKAQREQPE